MDCTVSQEALSALLDGEALGVDESELESHLEGCSGCRSWRDDAHVVTRQTRLALAQPAPAPSASLLAAVAAERRRHRLSPLTGARLGLVAVALAQIVVTLPPLILGSDREAPIHVAHEMGSFDLALAIGFLVAAWQPARARGMHILVGAVALLLVGTAMVDLIAGRTSPADELPHLLAVAGWALMYRVAELEPTGEGGLARMPVGFPRRRATVQLGAPLWQAETAREVAGGAELPLPEIERRAATG
jgi:predicted anti-sigma-YlaC factor YlaD